MSKVKNDAPITVGDIVTLKSGGPRMTVVGVAGFSTGVEVLWFTENNRIMKASIGVQGLKRVK